MSDLAMWSLLVGALAPPVIAIIQQPTFSVRARAMITLVICLVLGAGTAWFGGELTGRSITSAVLLVLVAALSTYTAMWKPLGVAPAIEGATSRSA